MHLEKDIKKVSCWSSLCACTLQVLPSASASMYKETTHLFADFSRLKPGDFRVDLSEATASGITCLKPEYIADYLMQVSVADFSAASMLLKSLLINAIQPQAVSKSPTVKKDPT